VRRDTRAGVGDDARAGVALQRGARGRPPSRAVQPRDVRRPRAVRSLVDAQARALASPERVHPALLGRGVARLGAVQRGRDEHDDRRDGDEHPDPQPGGAAAREGRDLDVARRRPDVQPGAEDLPACRAHDCRVTSRAEPRGIAAGRRFFAVIG
jgi:hypothetical protein